MVNRLRRAATVFATMGTGLTLAGPALALPGPAPARLANTIQISVTGRIHAGAVYDLLVKGTARERATAYVFVDYAGCARSLSVERRRTGGELDAYAVQGAFVKMSGWKSSSRGNDHACAYLVAGGGHVLATARRSYRVS
ncbi:MAG: hypothetical protein ABI323_05855 [Solirubrobacteraceae bacterium]